MSRERGQRGSVSVEAALVFPILVLVVLGGVHFGKVLMLRHHLAAAADVATRSAAIAKSSDSAQIQGVLQAEMGSSQGLCESLNITTNQRETLGITTVEVEAVCTIDRQRFSSALTGFLGPDQLSVKVAMPM